MMKRRYERPTFKRVKGLDFVTRYLPPCTVCGVQRTCQRCGSCTACHGCR